MLNRRQISFLISALIACPSLAGAENFKPKDLENLRRIELPKVNNIRCEICADSYCSFIKADRKSQDTLIKLANMKTYGPYTFSLEKRLNKTLLIIDSKSGYVRCSVTQSKKFSTLFLGKISRKSLLNDLRAHLTHNFKISSTGEFKRRTEPIEKLIRAKKYKEASLALNKLIVRPAFNEYVRLRQADLQTLANRIPTAYLQYNLIANSSGWTGPGLRAALNAAILAYSIDGKKPSRNLIKEIRQVQSDDGDTIRLLMVKLLSHVGNLSLAFDLIDGDKVKTTKDLQRKLAKAEIRRCLLKNDPICAAVMVYRSDELYKKKSLSVLVDGSRAFLNLGLAKEAERYLQRILNARPNSSLKEVALSMLIEAFYDNAEYYRAMRSIAYYRSLFRAAPNSAKVNRYRAKILLRKNKLDRIGQLKELPLLLAAQIKRAIALQSKDKLPINSPLWAHLSQLESIQDKLAQAIKDMKAVGEKRK